MDYLVDGANTLTPVDADTWDDATYQLDQVGMTWTLQKKDLTASWQKVGWDGASATTFPLISGTGTDPISVAPVATFPTGVVYGVVNGGDCLYFYSLPNPAPGSGGSGGSGVGGAARLPLANLPRGLTAATHSLLTGGLHTMNAGQSIQAAFAVSAAAGATSLGTIPPLCKGDFIDRLTLYIRGADGNATVDQSLTVSLMLCNTPPATAAEALNGKKLLDAVSVPMIPVLAGSDYTHFAQLTVPLSAVIGTNELHAALVVVGISGAAISGAGFLGVQRR